MTPSNDMARNLCLHEELQTSLELLKSGFGHLQEIDMGRTFYHLPHQLMASGFERLMKCYISLVYTHVWGRSETRQGCRAPDHGQGTVRPRAEIGA